MSREDVTAAIARPCGAPSAVRIEGYSPRDGRAHGSLDAVVYACAAHHDAARTEWLTGLTTHSTVAADPERNRCGRRTDFTSDGMEITPAPEPDQATGAERTVSAIQAELTQRIQAVLELAVTSLGEAVWHGAEAHVPTSGEWVVDQDCGPAVLRVSVAFEATGRTREQAHAACIAEDPHELEPVRRAARAVAAGGPEADAARGRLAALCAGGAPR